MHTQKKLTEERNSEPTAPAPEQLVSRADRALGTAGLGYNRRIDELEKQVRELNEVIQEKDKQLRKYQFE